jgi:8-oxo-dGTP pyrophosphatase MutT (NUDIX family)
MTLTTLVALVVVPHEGRYLVVEERDGTFYLPAGRVEPGESLTAAAVRETAEEAGIAIELRGILGFDHWWSPLEPPRAKLRFAFAGFPSSPASRALKTRPDEHSRGARWVRKEELRGMPLRDPEVLDWIERFERAETLLPCDAYGWMGPSNGASGSARLR